MIQKFEDKIMVKYLNHLKYVNFFRNLVAYFGNRILYKILDIEFLILTSDKKIEILFCSADLHYQY